MSSVETVSALERRLNASIPLQVFRNQFAAHLKIISCSAKIPGFRPGKIPTRILEQRYGAQARQKVLGELLQRSFNEAVRLNNLRVSGEPRFEINTDDAGNIEYSATFEVYPEVVIGDLSDEPMERLVCELSQSDVTDTITSLRKQRAIYKSVDRAAQIEDQVCIDFTGKLDGEIFQGGAASGHKLVLGAGSMLPEFETAITGMKAGETRSFEVTFPDSYHNNEIAGKQATFTVTMHNVEAHVLPEVDAEFARSVGVENDEVGMLESEIYSNLKREVERRLKVRNKETAMNALLNAAKFDAPTALVEQEAQSLMQQARQEIESRGMKIEDAGLTPESFIERANMRVKLGLIIADLAQKHDLNPKHEQVHAMVNDYAQSFEQPDDVVSWFYENSSQLQEVRNLVLEENIVDWTMKQAKATDRVIPFKELMGY